MKRLVLILAALGFVCGYTACERQKWEDSRKLHLKHEGGEHHAEKKEGTAPEGDKKEG